ncbi:hypothetical protein CKAH01_04259 [Colletotrichum kahawae]|uniref:Uncharacterized protein n=1 Tax=Colletotrichum kahawae TaxID=34407 RepID=A0AAD9YMJ2_COLKA|nr:hypothetical protein CKAH01_04259 [Colletotrichum kahawae]
MPSMNLLDVEDDSEQMSIAAPKTFQKELSGGMSVLWQATEDLGLLCSAGLSARLARDYYSKSAPSNAECRHGPGWECGRSTDPGDEQAAESEIRYSRDLGRVPSLVLRPVEPHSGTGLILSCGEPSCPLPS